MTPACRDVEDWPELLAGPMVRRVTRQTAGVFIATSVGGTVRLAVKRGQHTYAEIAAGDFTGSAVNLRRIGRRLWVAHVEAPLPAGTAAGEVVSYDIELNTSAGLRRLNDLHELGAGGADQIQLQTPLGYAPAMLPSFLVPPSTSSALRLIHSSCRRPAGGREGEPDALALVDEVIALSLGRAVPMPAADAPPPASNRERPHQLVLTGDQIYADDVAGSLLAALSEAGAELLGWDEELPGVVSNWNGFIVDPGWRSRYLALQEIKEVVPVGEYDYSANHLLTFGEWCAMYLFVWSDALWARSEDGLAVELPDPGDRLPIEKFDQALNFVNRFITVVPEAAWFTKGLETALFLDEFPAAIADAWEESKPQAERFGASVRRVRRMLANVATYTIFDDHEITDDWFLNRAQADKLLGNRDEPPDADPEQMDGGWSAESGRRLLRNGLSAYAIFQHWGNEPGDFARGKPGDRLLGLWEVTQAGGGTVSPPHLAGREQPVGAPMDPVTHDADALLGFDPFPSEVKPAGTPRTEWGRFRWDYVVPFASHRLLVLDTRTWRFFPDATPFAWPQNLDPAERTPSDTATLDYIEAAAAAWADAAATAGTVGGTAFADLLTACLAAARAPDAPATEAHLLEVADALDALVASTPPPWTAVNAITVTLETGRLRDFLEPADGDASGDVDRRDQLWEAASRLRRIASLRTATTSEPLGHSIAALAGLLETAETGSTRALAGSAARVLAACGTDVLAIFTERIDLEASLALAVNEGGAAVAAALELLHADERSSWFFRDGTNQLGAALISQEALRFQLTEAIDASAHAPPTIIVSAAPIFGNPVVEAAQRAMLVKDTLMGLAAAEEEEYEAWSVNSTALCDLLLAGRALERCVVLSGDVHYANTSVNDVELLDDDAGVVLTRYIQLTSSAARNADGKTLAGGYADDALWTACGEMRLEQLSLQKLTAPGGPPPPGGFGSAELWGGWLAEVAWGWLDPAGRVEDLAEWLGAEIEDLAMTPLEVLRSMVEQPINSLTSWAAEAAYTVYSWGHAFDELREDPLKAMFGEYLLARDVLRQQLIDLYEQVGVDPSVGVQVRRTMLRDLRDARLDAYRAGDRFDVDEEKYTKAWTHVQFVQTVGASNVGLLRFVTRSGAITGVRHELLWYPVAEAESADEFHFFPVPDGLVVGGDVPRVDWMGTLHEGAWTTYAHRTDDHCPPADR